MAGRLEGHVVVVTGAARGIGRSIAVAAAVEGAQVALTARDPAAAADAEDEVRRAGTGEALTVRCDVTDEHSVESRGDAVLTRFGRVDTVVANAGIAGPTRPMHEISPAEWRECVATELGPYDVRVNTVCPGAVMY